MLRKFWLVLVVLACAAAFFWWSSLEKPAASASPAAPARTAANEPANPLPPVTETPAPDPGQPAPPQAMRTPVTPGMIIHTTDPAAIAARQPDPPRGPAVPPDAARDEADNVALNLRQYGNRFGGNPAGTNAEIVKALNGGNPQGVRFLPPELLRLNAQGELVDRWDTPYFFHQMSADHMEVRSAGPDKTLWTSDDIVTR